MAKLDLSDIPRLMKLIRKLASALAADRKARDEIKNMTDEEVLDYADEALARADEQNNDFIERLENQ